MVARTAHMEQEEEVQEFLALIILVFMALLHLQDWEVQRQHILMVIYLHLVILSLDQMGIRMELQGR